MECWGTGGGIKCWGADRIKCWGADMIKCWGADRIKCWGAGGTGERDGLVMRLCLGSRALPCPTWLARRDGCDPGLGYCP
jgi:hypothetical protein